MRLPICFYSIKIERIFISSSQLIDIGFAHHVILCPYRNKYLVKLKKNSTRWMTHTAVVAGFCTRNCV